MCLHKYKKQRNACRLQLSGICCWTKSRISSDKQKCQIKVFQNEFWKVASPISVKTSWIANWKVFLNPFLKFLDSDNFEQSNEISFAGQNTSIYRYAIGLDWKELLGKVNQRLFTKCVRDEKYIALARPSPHWKENIFPSLLYADWLL